jgi:hypothetical protein
LSVVQQPFDEGDPSQSHPIRTKSHGSEADPRPAGNAYVFVYASLLVLLRSVLAAASLRPWSTAWRPLAGGASVGAAGALIGAIKLLPMLEYLGRVSHYEVKDSSGASLELVWRSLTGRDPSLTAIQEPTMQWRWWEYGGYVGAPVLLLALLGAAGTWKRTWPWSVAAVFFVGVTMGNEGPVWPLLRALHAFEGLRVPSRAIAMVVLIVAGLAAVGATWGLDRAVKARALDAKAIPPVIAIATFGIVVNAFAVTRPTLEEAFTASPPAAAPAELAAFRQAYGKRAFVTRTPYTDHYEHALRNEGMLNCHERLHLPIHARAAALRSGAPDPEYRGELWSRDGARAVEVEAWGPTEIVVAEHRSGGAAAGDVIVVNQNFDPGWTARLAGRPLVVASVDGVIGVELPAEAPNGTVTIAYRPASARLGALLTLLGAGLAVAVLIQSRRAAARDAGRGPSGEPA